MKMDFLKPATLLLVMLAMLWQPAFADLTSNKRPIFLTVFLHDDIPQAERASIRRDHFVWLLKDLEGVTGRRVYLDLIDKKSALTAFSYKGEDVNSILKAWTRQVETYRREKNLPATRNHKTLLLTRDQVNSMHAGISREFHPVGIATMSAKTAAAHELGHMFGGTHEDSEVLFKNGWWCETTLYPVILNLRTSCFVFSAANQRRIVDYFSNEP